MVKFIKKSLVKPLIRMVGNRIFSTLNKSARSTILLKYVICKLSFYNFNALCLIDVGFINPSKFLLTIPSYKLAQLAKPRETNFKNYPYDEDKFANFKLFEYGVGICIFFH